jgi:CheY-like chemotaxis protein
MSASAVITATPTALRNAFTFTMRACGAPSRQKQTCYDPRRFPMSSVLICATAGPVADDLHASPVWRDGVDRHNAESMQAALTLSVAAKPALVVIDRDLPKAERLVLELRGNAATSGCSIVIVATGDSQPAEVALLEAGANAVLRHPPSPEWEERLGRLLSVPARRNLRMHVDLEVESFLGSEHYQGRVQNISRTGMLVEVPLKARIGDELRFKLHLSIDMSVAGLARIVRLAGAHRYGCEFRDVNAWDARRLEHFLETAPVP